MTSARPMQIPQGPAQVPSTVWVLALLAMHAAMAIAMEQSSTLATLHAYVAIGAAACVALLSRRPELAACAAAYVVGSEVVWRMARASTFYEIGKYATIGILLLGLWRMGRPRIDGAAVLYFALMMPSALMTMMLEDWAFARNAISFNLSGHLTLALAVLFFGNLRLNPAQWSRVLLALVIPLVGAAAIAIFGISTAVDLTFGGGSMRATSGGFGPNQVSAALGLGAFLSFLALTSTPLQAPLKIALGALTILFLAQSALTFSRGGLFCGVGAILLSAQYLIRDRRTSGRLLVAVPVIYLVGAYVVWPRLDEFTDGALSARFSDVGTTGRDEIARTEIETFLASPLLGSGPGRAERSYDAYTEGTPAAHTEFTRVLAEHGLFGLASLTLLALMAFQRFTCAQDRVQKALVVSMVGWSFLFMTNVAMRLAAPSFLFGLACARFVSERRSVPSPRPRQMATTSGGGKWILKST